MLSCCMRVVLDTSVFVSAVMSGNGAARAVMRLCLQGVLQPLMGNALANEYEDVCARTDIFERAPIAAAARDELLDAYFASCEWISIYYLWRPNIRDEADNHVIELAVGGGATSIVTFNKRDFASAELIFPGLWIGSPQEFLTVRMNDEYADDKAS